MGSDSWEKVTLGDVARLDIDRVPVKADDQYPMAGLLIAGRGLFSRGTIEGKETSYPALHRLHAGQLVMRKLTAWEGPITTVPTQFDGAFVSSEFPTFTLDQSRLAPEFMRLLCQRRTFHLEMRHRSTGTAERRKRLNSDGLLSITIDLPPLEDQRRMVEIIEAFDTTLRALEREREAVDNVRGSLREELLATVDGDVAPLGRVLTGIEGGQSPQCLDRPPADDEWGVLKLSAVRPGVFRDSEAKALPSTVTPFAASEIRRGDLIITRSNTRKRVGALCRVGDTRPHLLLADLTWRLRADEERVDPDYLVEVLAGQAAREQIEAQATGTSDSMKKISQKVLRGIEIRLPELKDQKRVAATLTPFQDMLIALEAERLRLLRARTSVLEGLVSEARRLLSGHEVAAA